MLSYVSTSKWSSYFSNTVNVGIIGDLGRQFQVLIFKNQWHVCGIKDGSLVVLADDLETKGLGSVLKVQVAMLGRNIMLDLRTLKT